MSIGAGGRGFRARASIPRTMSRNADRLRDEGPRASAQENGFRAMPANRPRISFRSWALTPGWKAVGRVGSDLPDRVSRMRTPGRGFSRWLKEGSETSGAAAGESLGQERSPPRARS